METFKRVLLLVIGAAVIAAYVKLGLHFKFERGDWSASIQAIGSIAALGIAIFVMHGQSKAAIKLVAESDIKTLRRRGESVAALLKYALDRMKNSRDIITVTFQEGHPAAMEVILKVCTDELSEVKRVLVAVPAHELGSYDLTHALQLTISTIDSALKTIIPDDWEALHGSLDQFTQTLNIHVDGVEMQTNAFKIGLHQLG
jgi:hypothetical protein